jgi:hypothetical protein
MALVGELAGFINLLGVIGNLAIAQLLDQT